jgi:hypothetical protein
MKALSASHISKIPEVILLDNRKDSGKTFALKRVPGSFFYF